MIEVIRPNGHSIVYTENMHRTGFVQEIVRPDGEQFSLHKCTVKDARDMTLLLTGVELSLQNTRRAMLDAGDSLHLDEYSDVSEDEASRRLARVYEIAETGV